MAATKFDVIPAELPHYAGHLAVALFGDEAPMTAPPGPPVGRAVARIDTSDWTMHPLVSAGLHRPIDVRFSPVDHALYILDFGRFEMDAARGVVAEADSGALWRLCVLDPADEGGPHE